MIWNFNYKHMMFVFTCLRLRFKHVLLFVLSLDWAPAVDWSVSINDVDDYRSIIYVDEFLIVILIVNLIRNLSNVKNMSINCTNFSSLKYLFHFVSESRLLSCRDVFSHGKVRQISNSKRKSFLLSVELKLFYCDKCFSEYT